MLPGKRTAAAARAGGDRAAAARLVEEHAAALAEDLDQHRSAADADITDHAIFKSHARRYEAAFWRDMASLGARRCRCSPGPHPPLCSQI